MESITSFSKSIWGFSPQSIPGLALWMDAADTSSVTKSGSTLVSLSDKSGNGNTITVSNGPTYPPSGSYIQNGLNGILMTGSTSYITPSFTLSSGSNMCMYMVAKIVSLANTFTISSSSANYSFYVTSSLIPTWNLGGTITSGTAISSGINLFGIRSFPQGGADYPAASNYATSIFVNGTFNVSNQQAGNFFNTSVQYTTSNANASNVVVVYEMIMFNSALTPYPTQHQQIEGYLAWKWGLQANLPATHPYKSSLGVMPFSRSFIPPDIGSCNLWLDGKDASTITLSGSSVTQWNDKSGNGYNAVGTAGSYPTYNSTTGALTFNSSFLNVASSTLTTSTTQSGFFVASITSPASSGSINTVIGPSPGSVGGLQIRFDSSFMRFLNAGITSYVTSTLTTPNATTSAGLTQLFGYVMSAGATSPYQNGVALSTGTVATLGGSNHVMLGARGTIGSTIEYLTGTICEVVLYSTALSTTQRQQIEGYLIWKWGLQRVGYYPSTAPFYKYPSASTTFNPLQISGLTLWLDAADSTTITTSGSNVTGWNDKSGNARNCTISGTPTLLTSSLNGLNGIQFYNTTSANTNAWTSPSFAISSTNSISAFVVGNSIPVNPGNIYFISAGTSAPSTPNNNLSMLINTSTAAYRLYVNGSTYSSTAFTNTNGVTNLYEVTYNNATETPYVNGTVYVTNGGSGTGLASSQYIGSYTGTGGATLKEYEILLFNVSLTTIQRQQVEGYLSWKWGLRANLPTTHPYYNVKP